LGAPPFDSRRQQLCRARIAAFGDPAERESSFGSQAEAGAKTREILMPTLLTLKKRQRGDLWLNFKTALDKLAHEPQPETYDALFSSDSF